MKQTTLGGMILGLALAGGCAGPIQTAPPPLTVPHNAKLIYYSGGRSGFSTTIPAPGNGVLYLYGERPEGVVGVQPVRSGDDPQITLSAFTRVYFVPDDVGPSSRPAK